MRNTTTVLSVFSGRLYDIGIDAADKFIKISNFVHKNSKCKTLWASCRTAYDIVSSNKSKADIITISPDLYFKSKKIGYSPIKYAQDTVNGFLNASKKSKFKI